MERGATEEQVQLVERRSSWGRGERPPGRGHLSCSQGRAKGSVTFVF